MATGGRQKENEADDTVNKLTCAICLEKFRRPKLLPCFHTFCQSCLQGVAGSCPTFPCPACRAVVLIPPAGIKALQSNFYIEDDSSATSSSPSPRHLCDVCADEREATFSCLQCQQRFCLPCRQYHDSFAVSSGHTTVPLTEEDEGCGKEISLPEKQKAALCPKHPDQPLLLHCSTCKVSLCLQCKLTQHEGHPTQDLADASAKVKDKLKDRLGNLAQEILELDHAVTAFQHRCSKLQETRQATEEGFRARADTLHQWVAQSLGEAVDSLQSCSQQLSKPWQDHAEQLSNRKLALQAQQDHILRLLKDGQEVDLLSLEAQLSSRLEEEVSLEERMKEISKSMPPLSAEYNVTAVNPVMVRSFIGVLAPPPQQTLGSEDTESPVLTLSAQQQTIIAVGANDSDIQQRRHQLPPSPVDSFAPVVPVNDSDLQQGRDPSPASHLDNLPPAVPVKSSSSDLQQGRDQSPTSVLQNTSVALPAQDSDLLQRRDCLSSARNLTDLEKENPASELDFSKKPASELDFSKKSARELDFSKKSASELDFFKKPASELDFSKKPASELDFSKKPANELDFSKKPASELDFPKKPVSELDFSKKPAYSEFHFSKNPAREMYFSKNPQIVTVTACPVSQNRLWVLYRAVAGSIHHLQLLDADGQVLTTVNNPRSCPRLLRMTDDTVLSWAQNSSSVHLIQPDGTLRAYNMGRKIGDLISSATHDVLYMREVNKSRLHHVTFLSESSLETSQTQSSVTSLPPGQLTHTVSEAAALDSIPSRGVPVHASVGGRYFVFTLYDRVEVYARAGSRSSAFVCSYRAKRSPADARFCHTGGKEMLLVLVSADDRVHVVDHTDGGRFVRYLDTAPLNLYRPCRLATDRHHRRVWIVCEGGRVVVVDL